MSSSKHSCTRQYQLDNGDVIKVAIQKKDENNLFSRKRPTSVVQANQSNVNKQTGGNGNKVVSLLPDVVQTSKFAEVENKQEKVLPNVINGSSFITQSNKDTEAKSSSPHVVYETINENDEDEKVTPLLDSENNFTQLKIDENGNPLLHDTTDQNNNENTQPKTDENEHSLPLHDAVIGGNIERVKELLADNENPNKKDENQISPLHLACLHKHLNITKKLIDNFSLPDAQDINLNTPLHYAIINSDSNKIADDTITKLVERLLDTQPSIINMKNIFGYSALHLSAAYGLLDVTKKLIEYGADIHAIDNEHNTALDYAIDSGNQDIINLLSNIKNQDGHTPKKEKKVITKIKETFKKISPFKTNQKIPTTQSIELTEL